MDSISKRKNNWQIKKLGEIANIQGGGTPPTNVPQYFQGNINWYTPTEIPKSGTIVLDNSLRQISEEAIKYTKISPAGTVLLSSRATIGPTAITSTASGYNQGIKGIEPIQGVADPWYIANWLHANREVLIARASGATFKEISTTEVKNLDIPVPPLEEQKRIVKKVDTIFEKIKNAKENTEKNLHNSKELFESYLESIFTSYSKEQLKNSLSELFLIKPPKSEAKLRLKATDLVSFLPMEDLQIGSKEFVCNKQRRLDEVQGSYTYFANEDVLLAKITPCFENGKLGIARRLRNRVGFGSSEYIVFRSKGEVIPDYLYYFLSRQQFRKDGEKRMSGASGHKRVSKEFIENTILSYPADIREQKQMVKKLDELSEQTKKLEENYSKKLLLLDELKKSVLAKAFAGEL